MSIFNAIMQRRSIGKMTQERPTRIQIERILEAATHAPNHHNAQPWKFFVLAGKARVDLGEVMAESLLVRMGGIQSDNDNAILVKEHGKLLRAPIVIAVAAEYPQQSNVLEIENIEAAAAAVENMLLTAAELGLAAIWRTGDASYDPQVKQWLGLSVQDNIVAFVYLGYPSIAVPERHPIDFREKTHWLGWES